MGSMSRQGGIRQTRQPSTRTRQFWCQIDRLICGHLLYQKNFFNYLAKKFEKIKKKKKHKKCHFLVSKSPTLHISAPILVANQPSDLWPSFIQKAFLKIFSKKNQKNQKIQKKH